MSRYRAVGRLFGGACCGFMVCAGGEWEGKKSGSEGVRGEGNEFVLRKTEGGRKHLRC